MGGGCVDQMHNGSFETGTFMYWTTSGSPSVISTGGDTGWHSALLGGHNNCPGRKAHPFGKASCAAQ
jgi:hypothetical protein